MLLCKHTRPATNGCRVAVGGSWVAGCVAGKLWRRSPMLNALKRHSHPLYKIYQRRTRRLLGREYTVRGKLSNANLRQMKENVVTMFEESNEPEAARKLLDGTHRWPEALLGMSRSGVMRLGWRRSLEAQQETVLQISVVYALLLTLFGPAMLDAGELPDGPTIFGVNRASAHDVYIASAGLGVVGCMFGIVVSILWLLYAATVVDLEDYVSYSQGLVSRVWYTPFFFNGITFLVMQMVGACAKHELLTSWIAFAFFMAVLVVCIFLQTIPTYMVGAVMLETQKEWERDIRVERLVEAAWKEFRAKEDILEEELTEVLKRGPPGRWGTSATGAAAEPLNKPRVSQTAPEM